MIGIVDLSRKTQQTDQILSEVNRYLARFAPEPHCHKPLILECHWEQDGVTVGR